MGDDHLDAPACHHGQVGRHADVQRQRNAECRSAADHLDAADYRHVGQLRLYGLTSPPAGMTIDATGAI